MPAHDYDCAACGRRFEVIHGVHADRPTQCPLCGSGPIRKAISAPTIHYKGSGWAKKERSATATPKGSNEPAATGDTAAESTAGSKSSEGAAPDAGPTPKTAPTPASPTPTAD